MSWTGISPSDLARLDYATKLALAIRLTRAEASRPTASPREDREGPSFAEFIARVFPGYEFSPFHRLLAERLEGFLGEAEAELSPRLVLSVPPRHGKSTLASVLLPAYALGRNPDWPIIHASYAADLSNDFSRQVRNLLPEEEYQAIFSGVLPATDSKSVERWHIGGRRGVFISTGVGGPLTGRGAKLLIIDDPIKNARDADSAVFRAGQRNWYMTTARTRLEKGAGILLILTRWHEEDLAGYVTTGAGTDEPPAEEWETLNLPALAREADPLGRAPGEALWPEKYDEAALLAMKRQMVPRWWAALMGGAPVAAEGNLLKVAMIEHRIPPAGEKIYQAWDLAISEKTTADYTVGATIGIDADKNVDILDIARDRWDFNASLAQMGEQAKVWSPASIAIETNNYQAAAFQEATRRYLLPFREIRADRDKTVRAQLLADRIAMGKVFVNKTAPWWRTFEAEALAFPAAAHDDQVDAVCHALQLAAQAPWWQDERAMEYLAKR